MCCECAESFQSSEIDPQGSANYSLLQQICNSENVETGATCDTNDLSCLCGASTRSKTAACQKVSCSASDYDGKSSDSHRCHAFFSLFLGAENLAETQTLSMQLCGSVYSTNTSLGTAVSSAIASATAVAAAAVESKDATSVLSYPACAVSWQTSREWLSKRLTSTTASMPV